MFFKDLFLYSKEHLKPNHVANALQLQLSGNDIYVVAHHNFFNELAPEYISRQMLKSVKSYCVDINQNQYCNYMLFTHNNIIEQRIH